MWIIVGIGEFYGYCTERNLCKILRPQVAELAQIFMGKQSDLPISAATQHIGQSYWGDIKEDPG